MRAIEGVRWMHQAWDRKMGVESERKFEGGSEFEGFGIGGDWIWRLDNKWLGQQLAVYKCEVC